MSKKIRTGQYIKQRSIRLYFGVEVNHTCFLFWENKLFLKYQVNS